MEMKTAVVILNWNTEGFLRDFLPGLLHSVSKIEGAEVIVADNASTDGSMEVMPTNEVFTIDCYVHSPKYGKRNFIRPLEHLVYLISFPKSVQQSK